ncbi:MAG: cytochrome c-type biogenesis protein [Paracoccaceae bacterium]
MRWILLVITLSFAAPALAVQPGEMLADPALEARARAISKELRCLVCRNENIDDSHAELAKDLRVLVRERLTAGDSDEETVGYVVSRYGEFVLLRPRMAGLNLVIWLAGPALLIIGGVGAFIFVRRRRSAVKTSLPPLTEAEAARLAELTRES